MYRPAWFLLAKIWKDCSWRYEITGTYFIMSLCIRQEVNVDNVFSNYHWFCIFIVESWRTIFVHCIFYWSSPVKMNFVWNFIQCLLMEIFLKRRSCDVLLKIFIIFQTNLIYLQREWQSMETVLVTKCTINGGQYILRNIHKIRE